MQTHGLTSFAMSAAIAALLLAASPRSTWAAPTGSAARSAPNHPADVFTPVVVTPMGPRRVAVPGTDNLYHVVYELELTNAKPTAATLRRIDVLDADTPNHVLASYSGQRLIDGLRTLAPQPA